MAIFPRPVSPKRAVSDFWGYFLERRAHKWTLLGVSAAITWVIIWGFLLDSKTNTAPRQNKITYFQSWDANRPDTVIIAKQKADLARQEVLLRKHQKEMQVVADKFGVEWRTEEARNTARRKEVLTAINAQLDANLEKAKREEAAAATKGEKAAKP